MNSDRRAFLRLAGAAVCGAGRRPVFGPAFRAAGSAFAAGNGQAGQAPAIVTSERARPSAAFGATAGDVDGDRAIIWSRTDRPARLVVEYATTESFANPSRVVGPAALEATDYTARVDVSGLREGQRIFYRARFQSLKDLGVWSEPIAGTFTTPSRSSPRDVTVAWTADTVGQGWGINPDMGGMRLYDAMRQAGADVFIHVGDTIYADAPLQAEVKLDDGRVWRNLVTPEKSKVAETLDEFRGNHRYNLLDEHVRRFNASLSQFVIWDDHEVLNNWYPTEILGPDDVHAEHSVALLAARAKRAFQEYTPMRFDPTDPERIYRACRFGPLVEIFGFDMRSYRGANSTNRQTTISEESGILGAAQVNWLKRRLLASSATWKIIAATCRSVWSSPTVPTSKPWRTGTTVRLSAASWSLRACSDSSAIGGSGMSSSSLATCTIAPRTTTTRPRPRSPSFIRSGSSSPAPRTPARSARPRSIARLGHK